MFNGRIGKRFWRAAFPFMKKSESGWTDFARLNVEPEYTDIDTENKRVTGVVKYDGTIYLTVKVDVARGTVETEGSLRRIRKQTRPFKKSHYIKMIEEEAMFLVEDPEGSHRVQGEKDEI